MSAPRRSALYRGSVLHARRDIHAQRTFRYPLYVAAIDLDELPVLDRELRLFSHGRRTVFSLDDRDYQDGERGLARAHAALLARHDLAAPATTRLVTNLRVLGYTFNPVSFFLGYDAAGELTSVVAEVNNTYGGRFRYVLGPAQRLARGPGIGFRHDRELFVSPFLHGHASYEFWFEAPLDGDELTITMHVETAGATGGGRAEAPGEARDRDGRSRVFVARLHGTRAPLTDRVLARAAVRYPLMTAQVIGLIHLEALKLRLLGVPYRRPGRDHRPITEPNKIVTSAPRPASMK